MAVRIDDRRHHGLAGEIDARRAGGRRHLAPSSDRRDAGVLDDECRILDGSAAVACDEASALEQGRAGRPGRLAYSGPRACGDKEQAGGE